MGERSRKGTKEMDRETQWKWSNSEVRLRYKWERKREREKNYKEEEYMAENRIKRIENVEKREKERKITMRTHIEWVMKQEQNWG